MRKYMTTQGFEAIGKEIDFLWHEERPHIVNQVHEAAAQGDRSENASYIYGKKRLREIDGRLRYLRRKLDGVTVVDPADQIHHDDVRFAAIVTVLDENEQTHTWRLVDKDESDPNAGRISVQSPIGMALLGKAVGDCVQVRLPRGTVDYEITDLRYGVGKP